MEKGAGPVAWVIDSAHSSIEFAVRHLAVSTVRGRFEKLEGSVEVEGDRLTRLEATVDVASINTREPQRDAHLRSADFFDAENHPHMTYRSTQVERLPDGRYRIDGEITIRGVTRPITLETEDPVEFFQDHMNQRRFGFTANGKLSRKDFGLTWNVVLEAGRLMVGDEVKVTVAVEAFEPAEQLAKAGGAG
jgi:polyisoprenoid-binding protein YceI